MANTYSTLGALFTAIANAIRGKTGGSAAIKADDFPSAISAIETGPDLSNDTATAADVRSGKTFHTSTGAATGTMADASLTAGVSINTSTGVITGSATSGTGYATTKTKTATAQLSTQAATIWTPTTTDQTIASNKYLLGAQTIKGDANLVAANIAKDVTIFGVTGTHAGGGVSTLPTGTTLACPSTMTLQHRASLRYDSTLRHVVLDGASLTSTQGVRVAFSGTLVIKYDISGTVNSSYYGTSYLWREQPYGGTLMTGYVLQNGEVVRTITPSSTSSYTSAFALSVTCGDIITVSLEAPLIDVSQNWSSQSIDSGYCSMQISNTYVGGMAAYVDNNQMLPMYLTGTNLFTAVDTTASSYMTVVNV